jgi:hypothetical protein
MIVCFNCGAVDNDAMDLKNAIMTNKDNRIQNATCLRCEMGELRAMWVVLKYEIIIVEEFEMEVACLICDWSGKKEDAKWHDLSGFSDDTLCDNQEGSGWYECPECSEICEVLGGKSAVTQRDS